ncbi:MAG: YeeE/YedE family protein [Alphaproteobacteria bacterium]|nr:YeeE/YedE family protein [Alphaproteobacteria bacterium]
MPLVALFISGLLFGAGLTISGMVNPMKILNFLDFAVAWDPSLIFVMAGGLAVTFAGYRLLGHRSQPLFAPAFDTPTKTGIDLRLVGGAAIFGLGWGLTGFCPGPAIASLVFGRLETAIFVVAMAAGMVAVRATPAGTANRA